MASRTHLGRYELLGELGVGGMATVYRARDPELGREVAIKVLFPHLARNPDMMARFLREGRALARVEHPHIVRVLDVGTATEPESDTARVVAGATHALPFIVMEYIRGESLASWVAKHGPMLMEHACALGVAIAEALAAAHAAGIVHRDVKPANVLVTEAGQIAVTDFGVAQVVDDDAVRTQTGALIGTLAYMSPEQANGSAVGPATDVFGLGALLFHLATGQLPFANAPGVRFAQGAHAAVPNAERACPGVGAPFARVLMRAMAIAPTQRFASATDFCVALAQLAEASGLGSVRQLQGAALARPYDVALHRETVIAHLLALTGSGRRWHPQAVLDAVNRADALAPGRADVSGAVRQVQRRLRWQQRWQGAQVAVRVSALVTVLAISVGWLWMRGPGTTLSVGQALPSAFTPVPVPGASQGTADRAARAAWPAVKSAADAATSQAAAGEAPAGKAAAGEAPAGKAAAGEAPAGKARVVGAGRSADLVAAANASTRPKLAAPAVARPTPTPIPPIRSGAPAELSASGAISAPDANGANGANAAVAVNPTPPLSQPVVGALAPTVEDPAVVAMGAIALRFDTWCELQIDEQRYGRWQRTPYRVAVGTHQVQCSQGPGLATWSHVVTVAAQQVVEINGTLLQRVTVQSTVSQPVQLGERVLDAAGRVTLPPGRYRVHLAATPTQAAWVTIPNVAACALVHTSAGWWCELPP